MGDVLVLALVFDGDSCGWPTTPSGLPTREAYDPSGTAAGVADRHGQVHCHHRLRGAEGGSLAANPATTRPWHIGVPRPLACAAAQKTCFRCGATCGSKVSQERIPVRRLCWGSPNSCGPASHRQAEARCAGLQRKRLSYVLERDFAWRCGGCRAQQKVQDSSRSRASASLGFRELRLQTSSLHSCASLAIFRHALGNSVQTVPLFLMGCGWGAEAA